MQIPPSRQTRSKPLRCAQLLDIEALGRLPSIFRQSSRLEEDVPFIRGKLTLGSGRRFGEALVSNWREVWRVMGIVNDNLSVRADSISGGVRPTPLYASTPGRSVYAVQSNEFPLPMLSMTRAKSLPLAFIEYVFGVFKTVIRLTTCEGFKSPSPMTLNPRHLATSPYPRLGIRWGIITYHRRRNSTVNWTR